MARRGTTQADWVNAGQALLIEGGIEAVKLQTLTCRLGVSTGSFYHHFDSFDAYLTALAAYYGNEQAQLPIEEARQHVGDDPERLLREATTLFGAASMRQLNVAMRAWAQRDPRAREAVRRYDETLMQNLDEVFLDLGFDEIGAKARTLIMMGLATLDIDPKLLDPSFKDRWTYIRDQLVLGENAGSAGSERTMAAGR